MRNRRNYILWLILFISCNENRNIRVEQDKSDNPLFDAYISHIHKIKLPENVVIVTLQNNCKPCSFETLSFIEHICKALNTNYHVYILAISASDTLPGCQVVLHDTVGFSHQYGLYSFYDKIYVLSKQKFICDFDIKPEQLSSIKETLENLSVIKKEY